MIAVKIEIPADLFGAKILQCSTACWQHQITIFTAAAKDIVSSKRKCTMLADVIRSIPGALAFLLILTGCSVPKKEARLYKKITGVAPSFARADSSVFAIKENDIRAPGLDFFYSDSSITGSTHSFTVSANKPTVLFLKAPGFISQNDNTRNIFYTYPESRLVAFQNESGYIEFFDLNGDSIKNNELNFFQKLVFETGNLGHFYALYRSAWSPSEISLFKLQKLELGIDKLKNTRLQLLDSVMAIHPMSNTFAEESRSLIEYAALQDSITLCWEFKDYLRESDIYSIKVNHYLEAVGSVTRRPGYFFDVVCQSLLNLLTDKPLHKSSINSESEFHSNVDTIQKYFRNYARDWLLTDQFLRGSKKIIISDEFFQRIFGYMNDSKFKELVTLAYQSTEPAVKNNPDELLALTGSKTSIEEVIKKHKGKLIFFDFWASWCEPCRKNMPISRQLEEEYKGRNIMFVYISLDNTESKWKVASLSERLNVSNSYRFTYLKTADFIRKHNIREIPRYMLINEQGKMISNSAPAPGDLSLKKMIDENLN